MNTHVPPTHTDPLDPHEQALARVLRALPGGDPPPALDARILRSAQDALATPARRRRLGFAATSTGALWGIGSAAAAILAVGVTWRVLTPPDNGGPVPRVVHVAAQASDQEQDQDSTTVDFVQVPERTYDYAPPPPAMAEAAPKEQARRAVPPPEPMAAPAAPATALPEPFLDEHVAQAKAARAEDGALAAAPAPAMASAPAPAGEAAADSANSAQLEEISVTGSLARRERSDAGLAAEARATDDRQQAGGARDAIESSTAARERVLLDMRRPPDAWLLKIRARLREGDTSGARASLKLFVERYPQRSVPEDLRALLRE
jgi:hypothetical protein